MSQTINALWAQAAVDELHRQGLRHVVISPGSRSTPLVVAFFRHPGIVDLSVVDERSGAFFALGLAQATCRPVALVCTSGTAAAHYYPAVCEASRRGVPLLLLTADRPPRLQDCGASQAMEQQKLFGSHVRYFHQVGKPEATEEKFCYLRRLVARAMLQAERWEPGPVHLNVPFRKPLEPIDVAQEHRDAVPESFLSDPSPSVAGRAGEAPFLRTFLPRRAVDPEAVQVVADLLSKAKKPLIYHGTYRGPVMAHEDELEAFIRETSIPLVAEVTSGCRFVDGALASGDVLFESSLYERHRPDLVIRLGMAPVGWAAKGRIGEWKEVKTVVVGPQLEVSDPQGRAAMQIIGEEGEFLSLLSRALQEREHEGDEWAAFGEIHQQADLAVRQTVEEVNVSCCGGCPSLLATWGTILEKVREAEAALYLSSGMVLRDADSFGVQKGGAVAVFCNRGLNGIDGVIASGLGVALKKKTLIVVGDVAFRHDFSSLFLARELGLDATVLVVDNGGGAIFDYLPISSFEDVHRRHFLTTGRLKAEELVGHDSLAVVEDVQSLRTELEQSLHAPGLQVVVLRVDRQEEKQCREGLRQLMARRVDEVTGGQR